MRIIEKLEGGNIYHINNRGISCQPILNVVQWQMLPYKYRKFLKFETETYKTMDNILLYTKLSNLPDNLKSEVANFIDFLLNKNKKPSKTKAKFGSSKGMFKLKKNFDDPIEDFKDYQ